MVYDVGAVQTLWVEHTEGACGVGGEGQEHWCWHHSAGVHGVNDEDEREDKGKVVGGEGGVEEEREDDYKMEMMCEDLCWFCCERERGKWFAFDVCLPFPGGVSMTLVCQQRVRLALVGHSRLILVETNWCKRDIVLHMFRDKLCVSIRNWNS